MSDVFISYGRKDRPLTQLIADRFRNQGLTVWYDEHIPGGDDWYKDLINQLRRTFNPYPQFYRFPICTYRMRCSNCFG
jgi:predicted esterase